MDTGIRGKRRRGSIMCDMILCIIMNVSVSFHYIIYNVVYDYVHNVVIFNIAYLIASS